MKPLLTFAISLACAVPVFAQQQPITLSCASPSTGEEQVCPANTRDGVLLLREQSSDICQQGSTWSYDRYGITVRGGCSADFVISGRGNRAYKSGAPYGDHGYGADSSRTDAPAAGHPKVSAAAPKHLPPALPQGTPIAMQIDDAIRTSSMPQGQTVTGTLVNQLSINGRVAAPVGSSIEAKVVSGAGAPLDIRLVSLRAGASEYQLESTAVHGMRDLVEVDASARNGFTTPHKPSVDPTLIFPGSIFLFHLTSTAQATDAP